MNDDYGYAGDYPDGTRYYKLECIDVAPPSEYWIIRIGSQDHKLTRTEAHCLMVELQRAGV
jgi:hypothetical protein